MEATIVRQPASFRLRADLLEGLKRNAARENRSLNNYVESVLLDVVYNEPNEVTKAAIEKAEYPGAYGFVAERPAVYLVLYVAVFYDRTGDKLREHADIHSEAENIVLHGNFPPVNVDGVG